MIKVMFKAIPYDKGLVTQALEAGVDGIVTTLEAASQVESLARVEVLTENDLDFVLLNTAEDEQEASRLLSEGRQAVLARPWEVIPVENIIAKSDRLMVEVGSLEEARLAGGILERGVASVLVLPEAVGALPAICAAMQTPANKLELQTAKVVAIKPAGLGHRVCVDTMSMLKKGQGMLVGDSSSFTFLVHAETEHNEYVAARPFRVNAGGVHAYAMMPDDMTSYLQEITPGDRVLIVDPEGCLSTATVGRTKVEVRPMLQVVASVNGKEGSLFLQNAETIRLVRPDGSPVSVVGVREGDEILVHIDKAGRHFGMRVEETIDE